MNIQEALPKIRAEIEHCKKMAKLSQENKMPINMHYYVSRYEALEWVMNNIDVNEVPITTIYSSNITQA